MSFQNLLVEDRGAVRLVTLNRPDKLNALDRATITDLHGAFAAAAEDAGVRVVVLTGAGSKAFVAGADIAEMNSLSPLEGREFSLHGQRLMRRIETLGKPVIAMINGFALGGGFELAMCCHLRVAAETAKIGQPEINLALLPGFGATQRLTRLAGRAATLDLCLTGTPITATRAAELGLLTRVVAPEQLQEETLKLAEQLAAASPVAMRAILDAVVLGNEMPLEAGLDYESQIFGLTFSSADMKEGTSAFLERRKPAFVGR